MTQSGRVCGIGRRDCDRVDLIMMLPFCVADGFAGETMFED